MVQWFKVRSFCARVTARPERLGSSLQHVPADCSSQPPSCALSPAACTCHTPRGGPSPAAMPLQQLDGLLLPPTQGSLKDALVLGSVARVMRAMKEPGSTPA